MVIVDTIKARLLFKVNETNFGIRADANDLTLLYICGNWSYSTRGYIDSLIIKKFLEPHGQRNSFSKKFVIFAKK